MARLSLDNIDSIRSDEYDAATVRFVAKNWEQVSERVAKRTISWLRSNAVDMTSALQITFLELDDKALRYIPDLSRAAQRFVLENLEESDVEALVSKAHAYTVIVPELWDVVISKVSLGTMFKRELAAYEGRDRLPRAFKQALADRNVASVTEISGAIRNYSRARRAAKVDYVKAFEEATTVTQIRNAAELLLKACKDGEVESTSSARRAIRNVIKAASARDVKMAQKDAWNKIQPEPVEKPARASSRSAAKDVTSDLVTSFMSATRSAHMQEHAEALLKGARRNGIKLTAAQRRLLKEIVEAESSSIIRAAFKAAVAAIGLNLNAKVKPAANRFKDVDVEPRRRPKVVTPASSESDNDIPDVDLLAAWLNARRTADMKSTSKALLQGARRHSIKLNKETRECLKDIEVCESRSDIRAAYYDAVNAHQHGTAEQRVVSRPKNDATEKAEKQEARARNKAAEKNDAYGRLARTLVTGTDGKVKPESDGSEYEIDDEADQDRSSRRRRSSPASANHKHHTQRRGAASAEDTSTRRRRATSDTERVSRRRVGADRSRDTDFSDAARVAASVRRVRRPQDHI